MLEKKIALPATGSGSDGHRAKGTGPDLSSQILDTLEQGVVLWSSMGTCLKFNDTIFPMLELSPTAIQPGTKLHDFYDDAGADDVETSLTRDEILNLFAASRPFQFERKLPSGRVVAAQARPIRDGGHIVAYYDVTEARIAVEALSLARADAAAAQQKADAILFDERARQHEASRMARLVEWLQSCKSLSELYEIVGSFMRLVLPGTRGQLFIFSNSRDSLEMCCSWNVPVRQDHVTPDSCWALRRGRKYLYEPDDLCFPCDHVTERIESDALARDKMLCVPIVAHGNTVGLLHLEFIPDVTNPDVVDAVAFAADCSEHISMAIANVKLRDELQDQSSRDPLTTLFNRRYFLDAMRRELMYASSQQTSFALLMIDADKFKSFNDDHGHDAGDEVLVAIAEQMKKLDADGAISCRLGGEEFAILLPNADRTRASYAAEDLRGAISDMRVKYMHGSLPKVTVSIGISIYPTHGTEGKDLIKQGDVALYAAKNAGRNCWKIAEGDGMITFE